MANHRSVPSDILIIGGGVFGLSTAIALLQRPSYAEANITILDAAPELPNRFSASWDTSRMLRADYAEKEYTKLVSEAHKYWKDLSPSAWGGEGRYYDASLLMTSQPGTEAHVEGYLEESLENSKDLARSGRYTFTIDDIKESPNKDALKKDGPFPGTSGDYGYLNRSCGWVNAERVVKYLYHKLEQGGRGHVKVKHRSTVRRLLYHHDQQSGTTVTRCIGAELENGCRVNAGLVIVAAGAWTPSLVVTRGRAVATGQVLAYLKLTEEEQAILDNMPIYFNFSTGMFMVPARNRELKLGRHGFGYQNPTPLFIEGQHALISTPRPDLPVPAEAEAACKDFLLELFPHWREKKFLKTKLCWYCDTPTGDHLIDYHPQIRESVPRDRG